MIGTTLGPFKIIEQLGGGSPHGTDECGNVGSR